MRSGIQAIIVLTVFQVIAFFSNAALCENVVVRVVGNHEPPFRIIEGDKFSGIYFDLIKAVADRVPFEIIFMERPFKRALNAMKIGSADVMCGPNKNVERVRYMQYVDAALPRVRKAFYVRQNFPVINDYEDLKGLLIGTHRGKVYFNKFDNDLILKKEPLNTYQQAIQLVQMGRLDVMIIPEREGEYLLQKMGIQLIKSPYTVNGRISYITISKKSPVMRLQEKMKNTINQIKTDGTMRRILKRYEL